MGVDTPVRRIMTTDVVTIRPDAPVSEAARLLWTNRISGMPVVEGDRVIGVVTEYDLIARQSEFEAPMYIPFLDAFFRVPGTGDREQLRRILATTVRELMSAPAFTIGPEEDVQDAATAMYERHVNPIPVVDEDGRLLGVVSRSDIVRLMVADEDLFGRLGEGR